MAGIINQFVRKLILITAWMKWNYLFELFSGTLTQHSIFLLPAIMALLDVTAMLSYRIKGINHSMIISTWNCFFKQLIMNSCDGLLNILLFIFIFFWERLMELFAICDRMRYFVFVLIIKVLISAWLTFSRYIDGVRIRMFLQTEQSQPNSVFFIVFFHFCFMIYKSWYIIYEQLNLW